VWWKVRAADWSYEIVAPTIPPDDDSESMLQMWLLLDEWGLVTMCVSGCLCCDA